MLIMIRLESRSLYAVISKGAIVTAYC